MYVYANLDLEMLYICWKHCLPSMSDNPAVASISGDALASVSVRKYDK